ncbi:TM2 domain-containing protein [Nonlabens xiamenensis]|uniref:TM2 domain-containing protein n=1 Tax=Nonlabens xiamenensis TaxID=2341043 RepID=UPI000F60B5F5|nr:TM2 domain-containing protein [Nonlabens xiamenensis]
MNTEQETNQQTQSQFNQPHRQYPPHQENKKVLAGVLGIVAGALGVHKFVLGYTNEGLIQIAITIFTCGVGGLLGQIEGIIYLTKSDEEFYETYQVRKKPWF